MDKHTELRKSYWVDAATGGGVIGVLVFIITIVSININTEWITTVLNLLEFMVFGYFIWFFGKRRADRYGSAGFSFGQSFAYIIAMMFFTGFIMGIGNYLLVNHLAPEYYEGMYESMLESNPLYDPDTELGQRMEAGYRMYTRSPLGNVLGGIFGCILMGGVIGLFASTFIKRAPDIFADNK